MNDGQASEAGCSSVESGKSPFSLRVVHLPFYDDNPYQRLLMNAQEELGTTTLTGGGGGMFLRSALLRWNVDVVHFHWLHPYLVRQGWFQTVTRSLQLLLELAILRLAGKTLVWTVHNTVSHDARYTRTETFFQACAARLFHGLVVHSEFAKSEIAAIWKLNPKKISVYLHPNYISSFPEVVTRNAARARLGIDQTAFVFLFLGRVAAYKGVAELIAAFRTINDNDACLLIAGKPVSEEDGNEVRRCADGDQRIKLSLSYVPEEEVPLFMAAANVVTLPFRRILTSGSLVLAAGFSRAIIAPGSGGIPEMLPANYPLLFDPQQDNGLRITMLEALSRFARMSELGLQCAEHVKSWTWNGYARFLGQLYARQSICNRSS